jgi:hypothetical protein
MDFPRDTLRQPKKPGNDWEWPRMHGIPIHRAIFPAHGFPTASRHAMRTHLESTCKYGSIARSAALAVLLIPFIGLKTGYGFRKT